jgi:MFS family permease
MAGAGGLAVFVAGSVLCASADTLSFLVLGRVIQALGACTASVMSRAIARDLFDGEALARALALTMIAGAAAPGFSPLVGSALDGLFGWRITFLVVAAFGVVLALHYSTSAGETHPADRRASLAASAVASAYGRLGVDPPSFCCPPPAGPSCNERGHGADVCDPDCNQRAPSCSERAPDPETRLQSVWARHADDCDPRCR